MMTKKGISPLIATVLVIGFTIILAALVFQWGGNLFKEVQEDTAAASEAKIQCTAGLASLEVEAYDVLSDIEVSIDNKNDELLAGYIMRAYGADATGVFVESSGEVDLEIAPYGVEPAISMLSVIPGLTVGDVTHIGIFPILVLDSGAVATCENEVKVAVQ